MNDPALEDFLNAASGQEEAVLSRLLTHCEPIVDDILNFKIRRYPSFRADAEDVRNDILTALLARLRSLREGPAGKDRAISSFQDYVAVVAYNACNQYFRKRSPRREAFKNRLRYILRHDPRFALWRYQNRWLCGEARWEGRGEPCSREKMDAFSSRLPVSREPERLHEMFKQSGAPLFLEDVMSLFADLWQEPRVLEVHAIDPAIEGASVESSVVQRSNLQRAWSEIRELPVKQRVALLLSLRDEQGDGMLVVLPAAGVASIRKIAEALEMAAETLAALWKDLPLDDLRIAEHLGVNRQQVINLRKSARERLGRRMEGVLS